MDESNGGGDNEANMSSVQRQLAEYRRRMTEKKPSPKATDNLIQAADQDESQSRLLLNNTEIQVQDDRGTMLIDAADKEGDPIDEDDDSSIYVPPALSGGLAFSQNTEHQPLTLSERAMSIVCINQIPVLNVFDLTRRSHNAQLVKQGKVSQMYDLES